jgi:hypothetical protein
MMNYQDSQRISKQTAERAFATAEVKCICEALVSIAFYEPDWKWAQNRCLEFLSNENPEIRGLAATCLGHIARTHRQLEKEKVLIALRDHLSDDAISGQVEDALDDIDMFLQENNRGQTPIN